MFDIKQLDNAYDPAEQIQIALGVHPDQADAQQTTADALAAAGINPSTSARAFDVGSNPKPADDAQAIAPIARPNGARAINMGDATTTDSGVKMIPPIATSDTPQSAISVNPMSSNDARLAGHKSELDRLQNSTDHDGNIPTGGASGIAQIQNPFLRGLARVGDITGKVMFPTIEREIPGTEGHHQVLVNEAQGNVASDLGEQSKELALAHQKLENDALDNKPDKAPVIMRNPSTGVIEGLQMGDGSYMSPSHPAFPAELQKIAAAETPKTKEGDSPLADRVPQLNSMLATRFQVLNPGKALPAQYTLPQNATQKDYDRIDKSMEATERATGTKTQQDQVNAFRQQTQALQGQKKSVEEQGIEAAAQSIAKMDPNDLSSLKDISSMRGEQRLLIYNRAKEINPNFNIPEVNRKVKMMDNFTNGKDGQALQSFGTFLEHAGAASTIVDSVRARQSDTPLLNKPMNWWKQNMSGDSRYTQLVAALEPVKTEAENFMLNGHAMHVEDKKAVDTILSDNSSPAQMQAAIKQLGHTVQARFTEMNHRYSGVMKQDIPDAFSAEALAGANTIGLNLSSKPTANNPTVQATDNKHADIGFVPDGK